MDKFLKYLPHDKCLHLIAGVMLFAIGNLLVSPLFGIMLTVVVGAWKELVYDYYNSNEHTSEFSDFLYTCIGGLSGLICSL